MFVLAEGAEAWPWPWPSRQRTPKTRRRPNRDELKPRNLRMDRSPLTDEREEGDTTESEKESDEEEDKEDEESDGSEEGFVLSQEAAARLLTEPRRSGRKTPAQLHVSL